jgi:hypothetical protein
VDLDQAEKGVRLGSSERPAYGAEEGRSGAVRNPLGRFSPRKPMPGKRVGILALTLDVSSLILYETVGLVPAAAFVIAGICLGRRGLDSKGRGFGTIALISGIALLLFYTIMIIVGEEGFTPPPSSSPFG